MFGLFLDLNPTDQQTEANFYKTPEEFEAAANSTYSFYGFGDVSETVNGIKYTSSYYDMLDVNSDILAGINPVAQGILAPSTMILIGLCVMRRYGNVMWL